MGKFSSFSFILFSFKELRKEIDQKRAFLGDLFRYECKYCFLTDSERILYLFAMIKVQNNFYI